MECKIKGCKGSVDTAKRATSLRTGCTGSSPAYACTQCGRLYWSNGNPVFNRPGHAAFTSGLGEKPVANIEPYVKGQEGKGHTYYVILKISFGYLNSKNKFDAEEPAKARLFESFDAAANTAKKMGLEVEEYK